LKPKKVGASAALEMQAQTPRFGFVGVVGRPNVGKSTLFNSLVGMKLAITSRKAQTTRHRIRGVLTLPKAQVVFVDTPGLQSAYTSALNQAMNRAVETTLAEVHLLLWVIEAHQFTPADADVLKRLPANVAVIAVLNKVDRVTDRKKLLELMAYLGAQRDFAAIVPLSATKDRAFAPLLQAVIAALPEGEPLFSEDDVTDRTTRFLAAEFIREKLFRLLGDELPYQTAVVIEQYEELPQLHRIHAAIIVAKENQKGIVIGERGATLKRIGTEARREIEALTGTTCYLELWVKVKSGWADSEAQLRSLGLDP
jgi:GTPase